MTKFFLILGLPLPAFFIASLAAEEGLAEMRREGRENKELVFD